MTDAPKTNRVALFIIVAALAAGGAVWQAHSRSNAPEVREVTTMRDVAHDESGRLAPPDAAIDPDAENEERDTQQGRGEPPPIPVLSVPAGAAAIEQTREGTK